MYPLLLNTIENLYSTLIFIGSKNRNKDFTDYYKENNNIQFYLLDEAEVSLIDDMYVINDEAIPNSIYIFDDSFKFRSVIDKNGKSVFALFLSAISVNELNKDICYNIIPCIKSIKVKVLIVQTPQSEELLTNRRLKIRLRLWVYLRNSNVKLFNWLRHKKRKTEKLISSQKLLTNDNSRGYSIMLGNTEYINFDDGFRRTVGNEKSKFKNNIFFFGPCFIRGLSTSDDNTIPTLVQKSFSNYNVYNFGSEFRSINYIMRLPKYKKGDLVVLFVMPDMLSNECLNLADGILDLTETYKNIPNLHRHVFDDINHYDMVVQRAVAGAIDSKLSEMIEVNRLQIPDVDSEKLFSFSPTIKRAANIFKFEMGNMLGLREWAEKIDTSVPYTGGCRGAIVMNCNPFTLGHRYLIETAARKVDELFIFVLEEDKSEFSFAERIELVRLGTVDISKAKVFASGNFIISAQTLPGYFDKKQLSDTVVDLSNDLETFVRIAETLHISVRFAGSEPLDPFTCRYNEKMRQLLPEYGIEFEEIERRSAGNGLPISASAVRQALKENDWELIEQIVPESTLTFLKMRGK